MADLEIGKLYVIMFLEGTDFFLFDKMSEALYNKCFCYRYKKGEVLLLIGARQVRRENIPGEGLLEVCYYKFLCPDGRVRYYKMLLSEIKSAMMKFKEVKNDETYSWKIV